MSNPSILDPESLSAYRTRVRLLSQELWQETNPLRRMNLALQLADASTHLARLEAEALQTQHADAFRALSDANAEVTRLPQEALQ